MRLTVFLLVRLAGVVITDSNHGEDDTRSVDIWETINNINNRNNNNNTEDDREINEHINHQDHEVINQSSLTSPNHQLFLGYIFNNFQCNLQQQTN